MSCMCKYNTRTRRALRVRASCSGIKYIMRFVKTVGYGPRRNVREGSHCRRKGIILSSSSSSSSSSAVRSGKSSASHTIGLLSENVYYLYNVRIIIIINIKFVCEESFDVCSPLAPHHCREHSNPRIRYITLYTKATKSFKDAPVWR